MDLQGRDLSRGMRGQDVFVLKVELSLLGSNVGFDTGPPTHVPANVPTPDTFDSRVEAAVRNFQAQHNLPDTGIVDEATATHINEAVAQGERFAVLGTVRRADGGPFARAVVIARDRDVRREQDLGKVVTDNAGRYLITYTRDNFTRAEKASADLIVRVYDEAGNRELITSDTIFNADHVEIVDLIEGDAEYRGPSEYERLVEELEPLLVYVTIPNNPQPTVVDKLADLSEEEIEFLSGESSIDTQQITFLAAAARLALRTRIEPEIFYGFARQNLPTNLPALLVQDRQVLRRTLEAAIEENVIPLRFRERLDEVLERLKQVAVERAFEEPEDEGRYSLSNLLGTGGFSRDLQERFLNRYVEHEGPTEAFWETLREDDELANRVDDLRFTLQLGALTRNHVPLVERLQEERQEDRFTGLRDLAGLGVDDWLGYVEEAGVPPDTPGEDEEEQARNYALHMAREVEITFPTASVAYKLERADRLETPFKQEISRFLLEAPEFDLARTNINAYMAEHPAPDGIDDPEVFKQELKRVQRVFKLAPEHDRFEAIQVLLENGLDSAHAISDLGKTRMLREYSDALGGETRTMAIVHRADHRTAESQILMLEYGRQFNSITLPVTADTAAEISRIPELEELFGSLSFCECEHCRSVYSPAAYLVDVLEFVRQGRAVKLRPDGTVELRPDGTVVHATVTEEDGTTRPKTALDVLFERRHDLGEIELSCENTNTPLPYVDLVNEILEDAIAPPPAFTPFDLDDTRTSDLDNRNLSEALKTAFTPPLSNHARITVKEEGRWWTIDGSAFTYAIRKESEADPPRVMARSRQTSGTARELRAQPQYVNMDAYDDKLKQAVFPWSLPFGLWTEETRVFLNHLGVPRHELMGVFPEDAAPPEPLHLASERLNLTTLEREIITGSAAGEPHERWGLEQTGNVLPDLENPEGMVSLGWIDALRRVSVFLEQSGLNFDELTELLKTEYINPEGTITIQFPPPPESEEEAPVTSSCDLTKATITLPLDDTTASAVLERIQRFVRLQRKLSWSVRELDAALRALPPHELTDEFLIQLSYAVRLREKLKVPVLEMLSWWSSIDTVRFDDQLSLYEQLFLNRAVSDPVDPAFKLNVAGDELAGVIGQIEEHRSVVLAALEITDRELSLLVEHALTDATLNLDNLSALYRSVSLARALKLSIEDFLRARRLVDINPFDPADTSKAWRFAREVEKIRASGFSVPELDYLLRHQFSPPSPVVLTEAEVARILDDIRGGLQTIAEEHTFSPESTDRMDELLQTKLALLNWDQTLIAHVIATFNDAITYTAPLATLPAGLAFPPELRHKVHYAPNAGGTGELRFTGAMTIAEQGTLLALSGNVAYQGAVNSLFNAPRTFVSRNMRSFELPHYAASLAALPDGLAFPRELEAKVYYDPAAVELRFVGAMTVAEREILLALSDDVTYQGAVNSLFAAPDAFVAPAEEEFLTAADVATLFDSPAAATPDEARKARFALVLGKLVPYLRDRSSEHLVVQRLGDALGLELEVMEPLLTQWITLPSDPTKRAVCAFLDYREDCRTTPGAPVFAESNPNVALTAETFPQVFQTYTRLHKAALVANRFELTRTQLAWLFDYGPDVSWLDLNALPLAATGSAATLFERWERLADLVRLRDDLPLGEEILDDLFAKAHAVALDATDAAKNSAKQAYLEALSAWTNWSEADLQTLLGAKNDHAATGLLGAAFPDDYRDERLLVQLREWFRLLKRLGVSAEQAAPWGQPDVTQEVARSIRQAVKAKYDREQWYAIAAPLQDELRERQRSALVAYLVAHGSDGGDPATFEGADDLFGHYLIDVEMDPCMMTSRIKQANSSVQLFVQRSLMNLEPEVQLEPEHARQWRTWMKNYRVWEANRKVFLYPENWIEPELRDNKSPFFAELENALLQNEVREDTVENAFFGYLEKLDEVARLEMAGMYHQKEDDLDILHVFGRTRNTPHIYYYRRWIDQSYWTPWERVDVDIQGDHLIPLVWNRRLYLFWPIFTEKARDPGTVSETETGASPEKYWEIQFAWSEQKRGQWVAKKVSPVLLTTEVSRYQRTFGRYFFRSSPQRDGSLVIDVYEARSGIPFPEPPVLYMQEVRSLGSAAVFETSNRSFVRSSEVLLKPSGSRVDRMKFKELENDRLVLRTLGGSRTLLGKTPGTYRITPLHQRWDFLPPDPFFYEDDTRTFFADWERVVTPVRIERWGEVYESTAVDEGYRFRTFFHPYVGTFIEHLNRFGVKGLLDPQAAIDGSSRDVTNQLRRQLLHDYYFGIEYPPIESENLYEPMAMVLPPYPKDEVDFRNGGAYSLYNWELFFHAPLFIADRLSKNQRFEEAMRWFHYIFDPTDVSPGVPGPARFWKIKPFFENERVDEEGQPYSIRFLLNLLDYDGSDPELRELKRDFENQIDEWRDNSFNPHLIARLRILPYQWAVVMKYLDNIIAWGDQLFRRNTIESINEATQLYVLAAQILGDRPVQLPAQQVQVRTYNQLKQEGLDKFSNTLVEIENAIATSEDGGPPAETSSDGMPRLRTLYFCVPPNDKLLGYWDTVADRLFKIRHCMNIEGVARQLPLFEPPIEPGMLVRAAAAGVDLSSVLSDLSAPLPHYRFQVMLQKAVELCGDVRALGGALLSALEKKDAEEIALLRSQHELRLLDAVRQVKEQQMEETEETLAGLQKAKTVTESRLNYYRNLEFMNVWETTHMSLMGLSLLSQTAAQILEVTSGAAYATPQYQAGTSGMGAHATAEYGGENVGNASKAWASGLRELAGISQTGASMSAVMGSYQRREEEWNLQQDMAAKELEQIDKQIAAAEIRKAIAERDLENHDLQTENAREVDAYMREKFTNRELYGWMVSQLSALYFQSYQLAYDLAKRAERAYRHELGLTDSNFIQFGYWDSLKKGLLAGEKLHYDLKRMDVAYLEQNRREYELTKHVSLAMLNPEALVRLRETGECFFDLPEVIFDLDYPGHYMRRIKSVSLTIPCVTGPYTSVSCTLTLQSNRIRKHTSEHPDSGYAWTGDTNDDRFIYNLGGIQSIATSSARGDSGLFELNFRDERYLPFEGTGVISNWHLELSKEFRQFDSDTITDAVLHVNFTTREGGSTLKSAAEGSLRDMLADAAVSGLSAMFSARRDFPNEWHRFLHPTSSAREQVLRLELTEDRFRFMFEDKGIQITAMHLFLKLEEGISYAPLTFDLKEEGGSEFADRQWVIDGSPVDGLPYAKPFEGRNENPGTWLIEVDEEDIPAGLGHHVEVEGTTLTRLNPDALEDVIIVCQYSVS